MMTWERARLGDLVETQKGFAFKSGWYSAAGRAIIKVSDFTHDSVDCSNLVCIPEGIAADYLKYELQVGDVVVQTVGSWPSNPASVVGKCIRIPECAAGGLLNQNAVKLSSSKNVAPRFLFFLLRNEEFKTYIVGTAQGAASQAAITLEAIRAYEFDLPPLAVQRRIAEILSAYDDLIENNQRQFRILEQMVGKISVERFSTSELRRNVLSVPFWEFISENIPPYAGTKRYYATADIEGLTVSGPGIEYTFDERPSRAQKQPTAFSVWFARMKDTYKIAWYTDINREAADGSILSSGFGGFRAVEPLYFPFLFVTVSSQQFHVQKDQFCTGATQMSLTNEGLARIQVVLPPTEVVRGFGEQTLPLLNQMLLLQRQSNLLRRTRDLLLPRLLSGQVPLAERAA